MLGFDFSLMGIAVRQSGGGAAVENLLANTSDFGSPWVATRATVTEDAETAPDGSATADTLTESTDAGTHTLLRVNPLTLTLGETYNFSIHIKPDGRDWVRVQTRGEDSGENDFTFVNASSGTFGDTQHSATFVEAAANGFYRFGFDFSAGATDNTAPILGLYLASDASTTGYTGDGASGVHLWGAQLTLGAGMQAYTAA